MNFSSCPKKAESRRVTIIEPYRRLMGQSIPRSRQYWTLCAGQVGEGSEIQQLLKAGLFTQTQFHGVDRDRSLIEANLKAYPYAHWHPGDLYAVLSNALPFFPAIVNCDLMEGPKTGAYLVGRVLKLLTDRDIKNVMVVANFILSSLWYRDDIGVDSIIECLSKDSRFKAAWNNALWNHLPEVACYNGTGPKSRTRMGSIIFYR